MQVTLRAQSCKIDSRCCFGFCLGLFEVLVTVRAHFYEIGGSAVRGDGAGIL